MNTKDKNKIVNKGASFKILIKSKDIDLDANIGKKTTEELKIANPVEPEKTDNDEENKTSSSLPKTLENDQKNITPLRLTQSEVSSEIKDIVKKVIPLKVAKTPVNKDLDFVPEEDTDEEEDADNKDKLEDTNYDPANVHYQGEVAIYTDPKSKYQYTWCKETNEWKPKENIQYGFEDDTHTYTDSEGIKYFWDKDKNAWFPKIDEDFMARYQMSYGFVDNTTKPQEVKKEEVKEIKKVEKIKDAPKRKAQTEATWFDINEEQNTKVYVSNLPTDITEEEFVDFMQKCGLVMRDMTSGKMKVKLYSVPGTDILKGDALCTYIKIESVELALSVLDGYLYKGKRVKVERAKFEMKGDYNPTLKPKKKKRKDKDKLKKMQEKLFDWRPDKLRGERSKHERIVIVKNLFEPSLFDKDVGLILEYQQDLREECSKCGDVRKVALFDRHPEGVAQINMKEPEQADEVVNLLNGRWFGQRKLTAEIWDGKTKFKIAETDAQISTRINEWDKFLESVDEDKNKTNDGLKKDSKNLKLESPDLIKEDETLKIGIKDIMKEGESFKKESEDLIHENFKKQKEDIMEDYENLSKEEDKLKSCNEKSTQDLSLVEEKICKEKKDNDDNRIDV